MKRVANNKILTIFSILTIVLISLCVLSPVTANSAGNKPVNIGCLTPLSPPGDAAAGKRISWGAELAVKYVNEEMGGVLGGRKLKLFVADDAGTPTEGIGGFRRLVQQDNVVSVVGQYHSSVAIALTKLSRELKVPLFSTGASSAKITESQSPYIFSNISLTIDMAAFWVDTIKNMKWKKVAIMGEDSDYGTDLATLTEKYAKNAGLEVKSIIFPRTSADLTPMLLEIKAWKPDVFVNAGVPPTAYLLTKQAADIGLFPKVPMIASYNWCTLPEYWDTVGEKGKYILYVTYFKKGMSTTFLGDWMISTYKKIHNEDPSYYALNAFGQVMIIAQAINNAQSDDPVKIAEALVKWPYRDWVGIVEYKDVPGVRWHSIIPPYMMFQITEFKQPFDENKVVWPPKFGGDGKVVTP